MGPHAFRPVIAIALLISAVLARAQVDEATLKAAFVYNFALYTSWPASPGEPHALTLCIARTSALAPALRELEGKPVQARELVVRELETGASPMGCSILVLGAEAPASQEPGVLTICDCADHDGMHGTVIALVREGDRLRFDVDLGAANASKLSLSSKLLRLARATR
jgi:hypothetical protein